MLLQLSVVVSCACLMTLVSPLFAQGQYQQPFGGQGFPSGSQFGQPAAPDYAQPQVATNYKADGHQRFESVDGQGNVKGEYSYVDPNGKTITVKYTAGKDGFQVEGDHLPQSPAAVPAQPQQYQQPQSQSQYQPQQYQPQQYQPQQYQPQQYQPQQYQPQSQYQPQQYQPQQYQQYQQPQTQYQPQQYQAQPQISQYQPQSQFQYQPQQTQPSFQFQGFPQNRFDSPNIPPGVTVNQTPNGGFTYSYSPIPQQQ